MNAPFLFNQQLLQTSVDKFPCATSIVEYSSSSWDSQSYEDLANALRSASYVAVDTEFSGLGDSSKLLQRNLEDRFVALKGLVESYSLVELGIACFYLKNQSYLTTPGEVFDTKWSQYEVRTFSLLLFSKTDFKVSPNSLAFLTRNGFDFNRLFVEGIPFTPKHVSVALQPTPPTVSRKGRKRKRSSSTKKKRDGVEEDMPRSQYSLLEHGPSNDPWVGDLFLLFNQHNIPLVVHNGLLDLLFVINSFVEPLEQTFQNVITQIHKFFPRIVDTKYIAEFHTRENASYLEYLFHKILRQNGAVCSRGYKLYVHCVPALVSAHPKESLRESRQCPVNEGNGGFESLPRTQQQKIKICQQYAVFGHCRNGIQCKNGSHNIADIVQADLKVQFLHDDADSSNSRRDSEGRDEACPPRVAKSASNCSSHSAGFDALATGFVHAYFVELFGEDRMVGFENCIYIIGKSTPLKVLRSNFC